jgi:hypothetical protein
MTTWLRPDMAITSPLERLTVTDGTPAVELPPPRRDAPPAVPVMARSPLPLGRFKPHYESEYARTSAMFMLAERVAPVVPVCHHVVPGAAT